MLENTKVTKLLCGISNKQEHEQALIRIEGLIENYDSYIVTIEGFIHSINRYGIGATEFSKLNHRALKGKATLSKNKKHLLTNNGYRQMNIKGIVLFSRYLPRKP